MSPLPDRSHVVLPGSLRAFVPLPLGGHAVTMGYPGRADAGPDVAACRATLEGAAALGVETLHVLVEPEEIPEETQAVMAQIAAEAGIALRRDAIVDYSIPSDTFMERWQRGRPARAALWTQGGALAFSCHHGAGRSGLMACLCLIEQGLGAEAAMTLVRSHYPASVERPEQEAFLHAHALAAQ